MVSMKRVRVDDAERKLTEIVQASGFNYPGMIVARLFLGVFEAGFGPAIPLYFCEPVANQAWAP